MNQTLGLMVAGSAVARAVGGEVYQSKTYSNLYIIIKICKKILKVSHVMCSVVSRFLQQKCHPQMWLEATSKLHSVSSSITT